MIKTIILLSLLFLAGCKHNTTEVYKQPGKQYRQQSEEDNIREAVFRYQFSHNESGMRQSDTLIYFLSYETPGVYPHHWIDADPGNEFMRRFAQNKPTVKPFSKCRPSKKGIIDVETGVTGIILRIGAIQWISNDDVKAIGGYYQGNIGSSESIYYLKRNNGQWKVIKCILTGIS